MSIRCAFLRIELGSDLCRETDRQSVWVNKNVTGSQKVKLRKESSLRPVAYSVLFIICDYGDKRL